MRTGSDCEAVPGAAGMSQQAIQHLRALRSHTSGVYATREAKNEMRTYYDPQQSVPDTQRRYPPTATSCISGRICANIVNNERSGGFG